MNGDVTNEIAGLFWNNDKVKCVTRLMRWLRKLLLLIITWQHLRSSSSSPGLLKYHRRLDADHLVTADRTCWTIHHRKRWTLNRVVYRCTWSVTEPLAAVAWLTDIRTQWTDLDRGWYVERVAMDYGNSALRCLSADEPRHACNTLYPTGAMSSLTISGSSDNIQVSVTAATSRRWSPITSWIKAALFTEHLAFNRPKLIVLWHYGPGFGSTLPISNSKAIIVLQRAKRWLGWYIHNPAGYRRRQSTADRMVKRKQRPTQSLADRPDRPESCSWHDSLHSQGGRGGQSPNSYR